MSQPRFQTRVSSPSGSSEAIPDAGFAPGESPSAEDQPGVHVITFGCQMNKYDSLLVEGRFVEKGYRRAESIEDADVVLFNTCSVREKAEERVFSWLGELRRAKESRPHLVIGVLGCMAQRAEEEIFKRATHVDVVCGTRQIHNMADLVDEVRARRMGKSTPTTKADRLLATDMASEVVVDRSREEYTGGLRGFLAVMRGCDLNCTFCIVPSVRGRVQSRTIEDLLGEARWMIAGGAKVITLLGQTVNSYGEDLPKPNAGEVQGTGRQGRPSLADLLRALQPLEGLVRIRLITMHPAYLTRALAEAIRDCDKVDRFLPLPAQHGDDDVLRRMKRGYITDLYRKRLAILREAVPDIELASDWIVGFPGETEEQYTRSETFLDECGFVVNYIFQYSTRPGTVAAELEDDVSTATKKERNNRLLAVAERVGRRRLEAWIGRTVDVFVEEPHPKRDGVWRGRTFHSLPVSFSAEGIQPGDVVRITIGESSAFGMSGKLDS
ncbi:MAG: tRNA-2-methylthio-N6-dimethylallyladenosine synthase [Planctomycetota bacterium]|jgi:tRNA-2-methylthio-N6-dimethylallyladenosine synthase